LIHTNRTKHIKAVKSAIQRSTLSLTPQGPTPDSPTTITAAVPPPTAEGRAAAQADAKKAHQKATERVQEARAGKNKRLQDLKTSKALREDDWRKAHGQMEDVVKRGVGEAKRLWEEARKAIEAGA
jgi:ribosome recycling factor